MVQLPPSAASAAPAPVSSMAARLSARTRSFGRLSRTHHARDAHAPDETAAVTSKRDVPKRLSVSTPARSGGEGHRVAWADEEAASTSERSRWQRLRKAVRGRLTLGRSTDRFGGMEANLMTSTTQEEEPPHAGAEAAIGGTEH